MYKRLLFIILALFTFNTFSQQNKIDASGKKQGYWKKFYPNTSIVDYEGFFKDDIPEGEFIYYFKNGKIKAKMIFKETGVVTYSTVFHEDDKNFPLASGKYINKLKDSIWNYWSPNGSLSMIETFSLGVLNGKRTVFYLPVSISQKNGGIAEEMFFEKGKRHGEKKEYFENGVLKLKSNYLNDKIEGEVITYRPSGVIEMRDNYVNGLKEGWCYVYDSKGVELSKVYYNFGERLDENQTKIHLDKLKNKKAVR